MPLPLEKTGEYAGAQLHDVLSALVAATGKTRKASVVNFAVEKVAVATLGMVVQHVTFKVPYADASASPSPTSRFLSGGWPFMSTGRPSTSVNVCGGIVSSGSGCGTALRLGGWRS